MMHQNIQSRFVLVDCGVTPVSGSGLDGMIKVVGSLGLGDRSYFLRSSVRVTVDGELE